MTQVITSEKLDEIVTDEVFDKPDYSTIAEGKELKLFKNLQWTVWELIEYEKDTKSKLTSEADYSKLLRKVSWFDNIISFH